MRWKYHIEHVESVVFILFIYQKIIQNKTVVKDIVQVITYTIAYMINLRGPTGLVTEMTLTVRIMGDVNLIPVRLTSIYDRLGQISNVKFQAP